MILYKYGLMTKYETTNREGRPALINPANL